MQLMGIGEATATALVAMVGNAREFDSGRQFAAWLGLVPGQYSSGGKTRLGRITKAGDAYVRSLLVMGARAVLNAAATKNDSLSRWAVKLALRRGYWKTAAAIAAKNARMAWAVLTKGEPSSLHHRQRWPQTRLTNGSPARVIRVRSPRHDCIDDRL